MGSLQAQDLPLSGKVAIVTGASRGIGVGIALQLAKSGASIAITYTSAKSTPAAEDVAQRIRSLNNGARAMTVRGDLRDPSTPAAIVSAVLDALGPHIDILVNNAGLEVVYPIAELPVSAWDDGIAVNLRAPMLMTQAVLPHLRAPGRIINVSSVGARVGFEAMATYLASKAGLEGLTRGLAAELGPAGGHTVNAVEPGPVESDMLDELPQDLIQWQKNRTPIGHRVGTVEDIGDVVVWLAEERSRWITGQSISASGGFLMN
ncbi:dehydrogenase with different specificitie [Lineolata rhizophorae]|uniref:Dehydrogenase with different specificitie n=1 Tax=Lineolata rhizophorae TaxID=578093 RepID=A0A6A6NML5_9PEZI|nr:dehydrogenase with different specificitie [Lineolata rhizophorae]